MYLKNAQNILETLKKAKKDSKSIKKHIKAFQRIKPTALDDAFHTAHEEVFANTDCLACANCCKTSSPIIINSDIERISSHLRMKAGNFVVKYLKIDEDEDYVFQQTPCVFLNADNTCQIYEHRPKACSEYPHTDRKQMNKILDLTAKNAIVCPAVYLIVEKIASQLK